MANVIHRTTKQYLKSVNTPDFPTVNWIINPVLPACPQKYWRIVGDEVKEMTTSQKKAVDDAQAVTDKLYQKEQHIATKQRDIAIEALKTDGVLDANGDLIA
jgi:hypothetical protein